MKTGVSPVSVVAKAKESLRTGAWVEVVCLETVEKKGAIFSGLWECSICSRLETGEVSRQPIVVWRTFEPKQIRTVNGLAALAMELDIFLPTLPLLAGQRGIWKREEFF